MHVASDINAFAKFKKFYSNNPITGYVTNTEIQKLGIRKEIRNSLQV